MGRVGSGGALFGIRIDSKTFPVYANIASSARRAKAWTGGVNWHLNEAVKAVLNYKYTAFEGGAVSGNRRSERALLSRWQLVF